jgi:hypothetical protein
LLFIFFNYDLLILIFIYFSNYFNVKLKYSNVLLGKSNWHVSIHLA